MNDSLFPKPIVEDDRLPRIYKLLLDLYGKPEPREPWDPLTQFIYSILSSRTKTEVTYQVLRHLREQFGTWENLRDAPLAEIEDAIRDITFPEQKAMNLKASLQQITVRDADAGFSRKLSHGEDSRLARTVSRRWPQDQRSRRQLQHASQASALSRHAPSEDRSASRPCPSRRCRRDRGAADAHCA